MKALIYEGKALDIHETGFDVHQDFMWIDCPAHVKAGYIYDGKSFLESLPDTRSLDDHISTYEPAIDIFINQTAIDKGYMDSATLCSYISSKFEPWANEAKTFIDWRDDVYTFYYDFVKRLQSRELAPPTIIDLFAQLPSIEWTKND